MALAMCVRSKFAPRSVPHPLGLLPNCSCPLPCPAQRHLRWEQTVPAQDQRSRRGSGCAGIHGRAGRRHQCHQPGRVPKSECSSSAGCSSLAPTSAPGELAAGTVVVPSAQQALGSLHAMHSEMMRLCLGTTVLFYRELAWRGVCSVAPEPGDALLPGARHWD